ncbi:MAG: 16S rRNA (cytidine(1402)-2'-O)-methyltransferase [Cucumibacter sp.]
MAPKGFTIAGHPHPAAPLAPGLYIVATPIGNLADISLRALATLASADLILCEDTRTSGKLLSHYGISTPRRAFHEHNERALSEAVLAEVEAGRAVALISDAGTPLISDPGFPLVRAARARNVPIFAIPGASALLAALASSGLPADSFAFFGFPPAKSAARRKLFASLASRAETLVFYESPHRLPASLADMAAAFGSDREASIARELTKKFETHYRGSLGDLAKSFAGELVKGEVVVLVAGAPDRPAEKTEWQSALAAALARQPLKSAVEEIAAAFPVPRREIYRVALALRQGQDG